MNLIDFLLLFDKKTNIIIYKNEGNISNNLSGYRTIDEFIMFNYMDIGDSKINNVEINCFKNFKKEPEMFLEIYIL